MTEEQEVFLKHIQKQGLKRTAQRDLILDVFLNTEGHLSGEDLYQLVRDKDPTVGQTTVYRTLRLLTEAGLAREYVLAMAGRTTNIITNTRITIT
jgi:Fur family ferric uptake transcriptional regulator